MGRSENIDDHFQKLGYKEERRIGVVIGERCLVKGVLHQWKLPGDIFDETRSRSQGKLIMQERDRVTLGMKNCSEKRENL